MDQRIIQILSDSFTQLLIPGICVTIPLTLISFAIGLVVAVAIALIRTAKTPVFRGTPALVQLFVIFFGLPSIGIVIDAFPSAVIAFSLNVGAYASEALRAAIGAVPKGQLEAGLCVGMSWTQTMFRIVLPQAMRIIIPPTGNEFIGMLKTTSLVNAVPFTLELQFATTAIATRLYKPIPLLIVACIWYLVITSILMVIQSRLEKHFGKGFDARPAGARGKRTPLPGKTFGEPKDDVDKQNEATFAGMTA